MPSPKRFIAGAQCPQCKQLDKIRSWRDGSVAKTECVSCGYSAELLLDQGENTNNELQVIKISE